MSSRAFETEQDSLRAATTEAYVPQLESVGAAMKGPA